MSVDEQELKDFNITERIMDRIFNTYGAQVEITPTSRYCAYDANMTVTKANKHKRYTIEIKERNVEINKKTKNALTIGKNKTLTSTAIKEVLLKYVIQTGILNS